MMGYDYIWSSHPDHYVLDIIRFGANVTTMNAFSPPSHCHSDRSVINGQDESPSHLASSGMYRAFARIMRMKRLSDPNHQDTPMFQKFAEFTKKFNKAREDYTSADNILNSAAVLNAHYHYITIHNQSPLSYKLGMNQLGDMDHDTFSAAILPKVERPTENNGAARFHEVSGAALPASVDWRMNGSVTGIQDQGVCGSCWTFGSCGSLEGIWQLKTGSLYNLAEQQLVDCAWGFSKGAGHAFDLGCGGGFASSAFSWIKNNGGIALTESYPYLMKNGWCNKNLKTSPVQVTGYVNVTSGNETALQDAVANVGPIAVAIDASDPSFRFYTSGVYYSSICKNGVKDLDHEVLAIGYGVAPQQVNGTTVNVPYWLVKNSWSIYWGQKGFVWMSRGNGNNCGIATQATYPLV